MSIEADSVRIIVRDKGDCSKVRNCDICPLVMKYQKEIVCSALLKVYTTGTVDLNIKKQLQNNKLKMAEELVEQYNKLEYLEELT
jgi:hypothetical protein